jgi:hypothetical protein
LTPAIRDLKKYAKDGFSETSWYSAIKEIKPWNGDYVEVETSLYPQASNNQQASSICSMVAGYMNDQSEPSHAQIKGVRVAAMDGQSFVVARQGGGFGACVADKTF